MSGSNNENKYPISEIFTSPQGEGVYAGTLMTFIRLSGCTVGKPYPKEKYISVMGADVGFDDSAVTISGLPIYTEKCTLYDGRTFACDTDYRVKERMSPSLIVQQIPRNVQHVCITGGEPLMHDLNHLITYLHESNKEIHLETSGTIDKYVDPDIWVSVSPKFNCQYDMIRRADEVKILIDKDFNLVDPMITLIDGGVQAVRLHDLAGEKPVFLQPINFENAVNKENLQHCLDIQQEYPNFRVSPQMHKLFTAQTGQLVR